MRAILLSISILIASSIVAQNKISGVSEPIQLELGELDLKVVSGVSDPIPLAIGGAQPVRSNVTSIQKQDVAKNIQPVIQPAQPQKTTPKPSNKPKYYALLIGVQDYKYSNANMRDLDQPIKDASSLMNVLSGDYNFKSDHITFLKDPSRDQIIGAFEDIARKVTDKDNLLIFYAGHGIWDERLKIGYWLPADAKTDSKSNWISNSTIRDYISGIQSKHTLLVTDACFSGSIFKTREVVSEMNEYAVAKIYQLPSRKAMTSGTLTTVPDQSKFMEYLLKRLKDNTNPYMTSRQLFFSVETAVMNNTNTVPQFGVIQETGDEGGDFVFIKD